MTDRPELVPLSRAAGKDFILQHHRHNKPPVQWKFGVGLQNSAGLVGIAIAGRPVARGLDADQFAVEITRVCTTGLRNANSRLYGAICRAAKALGYRVAYTYTLQSESGSSLRAAGFEIDAELEARPTWNTPARQRVQTDLFGEEIRPAEGKIRWIKHLVALDAKLTTE